VKPGLYVLIMAYLIIMTFFMHTVVVRIIGSPGKYDQRWLYK